MARKRRRVRGNIRVKRGKLQAYVRLFAGKGGLWTRTYPLDKDRGNIQKDIDQAVDDYRKLHPVRTPGTLADDVETYLELLADRPRLQKERRLHLGWWLDQFGTRSRRSLERVELERAITQRRAEGASASHVRHLRTALMHLFTKLDGPEAPNPLRAVRAPREPDPLPRAIPYEIIDQLWDYMRPRRYAVALTAADVERVRACKTSASQLARELGVSETAIRKARQRPDGEQPKKNALAKSKARLQVLAYTGIPHTQIAQLTAADIDWKNHSVLVRGRSKGEGAKPARMALTPRGVLALRAMDAADAWGAFSNSSLRKAFKNAIGAMCDDLEQLPATRDQGTALRTRLADATSYDLRHSYLTALQLAGENIRATQIAAQHTDVRTTQRYLLASVSPELRAAVDALAKHWERGQHPGNISTPKRAAKARKAPEMVASPRTRQRAITGRKTPIPQ